MDGPESITLGPYAYDFVLKGSGLTGAYRQKEGRFRQADGGSLFLDEVSGVSVGMQVKLHRALQEREITRVGGEASIRIDVRVIAATNKDLLQEIENGNFREDLYYRMNVVTIHVPPLRDRREDIPVLAQHFLSTFAEKNHKQLKGFTPQAMDRFVKYAWPGNVRELMNAVERAVVLCRSEYLEEHDLPVIIRESERSQDESVSFKDAVSGNRPLEDVEKATILSTLASTDGNKSEAARRLGITRKTLHKKLKKYGMMG
jgi:two-component system response regulator HydG